MWDRHSLLETGRVLRFDRLHADALSRRLPVERLQGDVYTNKQSETAAPTLAHLPTLEKVTPTATMT